MCATSEPQSVRFSAVPLFLFIQQELFMKTFPCIVSIVFLVLFVAPTFTPAQDTSAAATAETVARVPELEKFHTVIYKLWHTAWPKKDITMLVTLAPEIEAGTATVAKAPLSGILRDKKDAWDKNVAVLQQCAARYTAAAAGRDSLRLLEEGERLHMQYEVMVRLIRPPMKELEAFHTELYMLYHHYGPDFDLPKIRNAAGAMEDKMTLLNNARLPDRYKANADTFEAARGRLSKAVAGFRELVETGDRQTIMRGIEHVHERYLELEKVFK
jgi:hypothetical protein